MAAATKPTSGRKPSASARLPPGRRHTYSKTTAAKTSQTANSQPMPMTGKPANSAGM
jgi:hypothetical protein